MYYVCVNFVAKRLWRRRRRRNSHV